MKLKEILKSITVEPIVFLSMVGLSIYNPLFQDILRQKVCHHDYNYPFELCQNQTSLINSAGNDTASGAKQFESILATTATWIMFNALIITIPAIFLAPFLGSWSDAFGRKIPIMINIFGRLCTTILLLLNVIYPEWPTFVMLLVGGPYIITGAQSILLMLLYSSVADNADKDTRTTRLSILQACYYLGATLGNLIGGQIASKLNYKYALGFIIALHIVNLIYIIIRLPFSSKVDEQNSESPQLKEKLCSLKHVIDTVSTACQKRPQNARIYILLFILCHCLISGINAGENEIILLFVESPPLSWGIDNYTTFAAYGTFIVGIAMLIILPLLKQYLKLEDTTIMILGSLSEISYGLMRTFAKMSWMMYAGITLGILMPFVDVGAKSGFSKLVSDDDQGKVFSFASLLDSISPILFNLIYNGIFQLTVENNRSGLSFLFSVAIFILILVIALIINFTQKSTVTYEYQPLIRQKITDSKKEYISLQQRFRKISKEYIHYCDNARDHFHPKILF